VQELASVLQAQVVEASAAGRRLRLLPGLYRRRNEVVDIGKFTVDSFSIMDRTLSAAGNKRLGMGFVFV
jgi:hypothetical protein